MTELTDEKNAPSDWAALRLEAEKLGISLSELQQKKRQQKLMNEAKKARTTTSSSKDAGDGRGITPK